MSLIYSSPVVLSGIVVFRKNNFGSLQLSSIFVEQNAKVQTRNINIEIMAAGRDGRNVKCSGGSLFDIV